MGKARPRHLRPFDFTTISDERKTLVMDLLRKSLNPLTRMEITAALGWPENILSKNVNKSIDPLMLLIEEGKIGRVREGRICRYYADPDISKLIVKQ